MASSALAPASPCDRLTNQQCRPYDELLKWRDKCPPNTSPAETRHRYPIQLARASNPEHGHPDTASPTLLAGLGSSNFGFRNCLDRTICRSDTWGCRRIS